MSRTFSFHPVRLLPWHVRAFLEYFLPQRIYFVVGMLFIFLAGFLQLLSVSLIGQLIDTAVTVDHQNASSSIRSIVLQILGVMILQTVFSVAQQYCFLQMNEFAIAAIRKKLYHRYLHYDLNFFNKEKIGDLISRINNDIGMVQYIFSEQLPAFLYQSSILITAIVALFLINVKLTLVMAATFPATVIITFFIGKKVRIISKVIQDSFAVSVVYMQETLQKIRTVKAFSAEHTESRRYNTLLMGIVSKSIRRSLLRMGLDGSSFLLMTIAQVCIIWFGSNLVAAGSVTIGKMITFIMITFSVGGAVSSIASAFGNLQKSFGATERLHELFSYPVEDESAAQRGEVAFRESIIFNHVSFSYLKLDATEVLSDISMQIRKGEKIGIVGSSGAGKSTFIQLLLRFYETSSGQILMDGRNINKYPMKSYRRIFGVVSQEIELFGRTILENISYGNPGISKDEVITASKYARAYDFIEPLPEKFDTVLGENGYTLSGGQRQRLCIARALVGDPDIIIFDEATSALDAGTEQNIREALDDLLSEKTVIVISHRLSSIRDMDRIFVLEDGRILESGSHSALMAIPEGKYRRLAEIQEGEAGY